MEVRNGPNTVTEAALPAVEQLLSSHPAERPVWSDNDDSTLICRQVQDITHDVKTFLFEPAEPAVFHHEPGQFLTLQAVIGGHTLSRCYTISTPPTRPHLIGITVKRQPGGLVSNWLHDTMVPGQRISADGPNGIFTLRAQQPAKYLFLSGGSGITPLMAMTRTLYDLGSDADIVFVHSARTPADILFRRELDAIASTAPNIRVFHICETDAPREPWGGLRGYLSIDMLKMLTPDLTERVVYCCGPSPYMAAARQMLADAGVEERNYHQESFSFEELTAVESAGVEVSDDVELSDGSAEPYEPYTWNAKSYAVKFLRSGQTITCAEDQNVLDAAFAAGMNPMSSCGQGMCGTCKTTMVAGTVDMQHQGGIRPREIAQNKVLICCSKPTSDLVLDA